MNDFIERLYRAIKREKKYVKFGISPFGIWRPGYPESIAGFDQYDQLYADAKLWLNEGWIDYFAPQLYWPTNQIPQSFPVLLNWWVNENLKKRHLWPGINIGRLQGEKGVDEAINQIMISRAMLDDSPGVIHWSIAPLVKNDSLVENIFSGPYRKPALIPKMQWLSKKSPVISSLSRTTGNDYAILKINSKAEYKSVIVYFQNQSKWEYKIISCKNSEINISILKSLGAGSGKILISIIDRFGQISKPVLFEISP